MVGMFTNFEVFLDAIKAGNVEFLAADVMALPLEEMIPGELPIVLYLGHPAGKEGSADMGVFFFDRNRFGRMVQASLNKPYLHVERVPEFMNVLNVEFD